jgi:predicted alpha/beta superfamily hydrolase
MTTIISASLPGTEVRTILAPSIDQAYRISVALPETYATNPERSYPTIYLTDANFYFGMVTELTRIMNLGKELPETIVVGIGYPLDGSLTEVIDEVFRLRARDLTPVPDPAKAGMVGRPTGGAPAFLSFIPSELIPMIEQQYRADPSARVLVGHSLGGLFTLYALFHQPGLFASYVAGSPSLAYGERVTFAYEAAFAEGRTSLPVKLYLGIGGREEQIDDPMVSDFFQFVARLESRKYEGLLLVKHLVENCGHCAFTALTFQAGLQAVLSYHANQ